MKFFQKLPEFEWEKDIEVSDGVDGKVTMMIAVLLLVYRWGNLSAATALGAGREPQQAGFPLKLFLKLYRPPPLQGYETGMDTMRSSQYKLG